MAGTVLSFKNIAAISSRSLRLTSSSRFRSSNATNGERRNQNPQENPVEVSDSCVARLRQLGDATTLRVAVEGGGCSGFQYIFELDSPIEDGDHVINKDGVSVIVDESSLQYLKGARIDYHSELIRSAFRVVNNPMAEQGCSCGVSFNVKIPEG